MSNRNQLIEKLLSLSPRVKRKGYWTTKDGEQIPINKMMMSIIIECFFILFRIVGMFLSYYIAIRCVLWIIGFIV